MTKQDYSEYCANVERNTAHLSFVSTGACPGCSECGNPDLDDNEAMERASEPHFSWQPCSCCHSSLGGDRHPAHGRDKDNTIEHFTICSDCLYFLNYGRLDDQSMLEIESH